MLELEIHRLLLEFQSSAEQFREVLALRQRMQSVAERLLAEMLNQQTVHLPRDVWVFIDRLQITLPRDLGDYDDITLSKLWAGWLVRTIQEYLDGRRSDVVVFLAERELIRELVRLFLHGETFPWWADSLTCGSGIVAYDRWITLFETSSRVELLAEVLLENPRWQRPLFGRLMVSERREFIRRMAERLSNTFSPLPLSDWTHSDGSVKSPLESPELPVRMDVEGAVRHADYWQKLLPEMFAEPALRRRIRESVYDRTDPINPGQTSEIEELDCEKHDTPQRPSERERHGVSNRSASWDTDSSEPRTESKSSRERVSWEVGDKPDPPHSGSSTSLRDGVSASEPRPSTPQNDSDNRPGNSMDSREWIEKSAWWSQAGGIVLLYPWLSAFMRECREHPWLSAGGVHDLASQRLLALVAVVDPEDTSLLVDPLMQLLVGGYPGNSVVATTSEQVIPSEFQDEAHALLRKFAALLPGFEQSSAGYLREQFLRRGAIVEPLREDAFLVRLQPKPLDVMLRRLPYPLGPFRLLENRTFHVELEQNNA